MNLRPLAGAALALTLVLGALHAPAAGAQNTVAAAEQPCEAAASDACLIGFDLPGAAGRLHYYASRSDTGSPEAGMAPTTALVVMHGHPRDANRSFDAGLRAARAAGRLGDTLVVAPLFQVGEADAARCRTRGVPVAEPGDALWTCGGWLEGAPSLGGRPIGAFAALDALVAELHRRWPSLKTVTLAGFSAGAQMLQHGVGFAADPPAGLRLRYVIADPGSWLYFDPVRPVPQRDGQAVDWSACGSGAAFPGGCEFALQPPDAAACPGHDRWKYGTGSLPAALGRDAAPARARYAAAEVHYLEGALDSSADKGTYYPILDKSCAAMLQGPYRLQRGVAYAAYDRALLAPAQARQVTVVPGCAHDVGCVLPSDAARAALFPAPR
ncbi:hypothetical protein ACA040_004005 [Xenophilus aerolatus]